MTIYASRRADHLAASLEVVGDVVRGAASADPADSVRRVVSHLPASGGKGTRSRLVLLMATCAGEPTSRAVNAAAGVELIHLATLHHDDVVDQSHFRRGVPTTCATWGNNSATFAGTYLLAKGVELLAAYGDEVNIAAADCVAELWQGQTTELVRAHRPGRSLDEYLRVIGQKTGSLFELACRVGAVVGGASPVTVRTAARFGRTYGIAFQLLDDLLDLTGDARSLGKPTGADIPAGIYTLPVIAALASGDAGARRLQWLLDRACPSSDEIAEATRLVWRLGGVDAASRELSAQLEESGQLAGMLGGAAEAPLRALVDRLAESAGERNLGPVDGHV